MFSRKVKYDDCVAEMKEIVYFLKGQMSVEKFEEMTPEELYREYERYRIIGIQDGWGYYCSIWKDKI